MVARIKQRSKHTTSSMLLLMMMMTIMNMPVLMMTMIMMMIVMVIWDTSKVIDEIGEETLLNFDDDDDLKIKEEGKHMSSRLANIFPNLDKGTSYHI